MYRYAFIPGLILIFLSFTKLTAQDFPGYFFRKPSKPAGSVSEFSNIPPLQNLNDSAQTEWISVYNDPINGDDEADAMVMDPEGNIYVTGNCSDSGATYGWDITTIKYNPDGKQQWLVSFDGPGHGDDVPYAIAVDQHGNAYIAGYGQQGAIGSDFLTMKIDSSGTIEWYRMLTNNSGSNDVAFSVAVDDNGNVFSTGATFVLSSASFDLTTVKYNSAGVQQWIQRYNSPFSYEDTGENLVLDSNDNIYITGVSEKAPGNYDVITLKYNNSGDIQWVQRYNGPGNSNDGGRQVILDSDLNVIVTGQQTGAGTLFDMLTIKYRNDGTQEWVSTYNGPQNSEDGANALVCDGAGNIYITGFSTGSNNTSDYTTTKYSPGGILVWTSFYTGPANGFEQAYDIALDNTDGVYITGYSPSAINPYVHYEYATVKYDTSGQEQWVSRFGGNSSLSYEPNVAKALNLDASGNVYVTGEIADEGTGEDFGTIKYAQSTIPVELTSFTAVNNDNNVLLNWSTATETNNKGFNIQRSDIRHQTADYEDPAGKIYPEGIGEWKSIGYVPGSGTTSEPKSYSFTDKDLSSGKYSYRLEQIDLNGKFAYSGIVNVNVNIPLRFALSQNFPNPFNPTTQIEYTIPQDGIVSLRLYNTLGQQVDNLAEGFTRAGKHCITFNAVNLAAGIYFYELKSGDFSAVKKLILLK